MEIATIFFYKIKWDGFFIAIYYGSPQCFQNYCKEDWGHYRKNHPSIKTPWSSSAIKQRWTVIFKMCLIAKPILCALVLEVCWLPFNCSNMNETHKRENVTMLLNSINITIDSHTIHPINERKQEARRQDEDITK